MGAELGLKPVQSLQNIAVVNGRPSIWGDGLRALIMSAPDLVDIKDEFDSNTMTATCTITRQINGNHLPFRGEFSQKDAELAGLWGRNTWKSYPKKMLEWRAFGFAARKAYADRLKGISLAEEAMDIPVSRQEKDISPPAPKTEKELAADKPDYPAALYKQNFSRWANAIQAGRKTAEQIISTVETKGVLSEAQKVAIRNVKPGEDEQ